MDAEDKIRMVKELLKVFSEEDRNTILCILRLILEVAHSPLSI